jgi:hypothetical protein
MFTWRRRSSRSKPCSEVAVDRERLKEAFVAGLVAVPVTVLTHELAHYFAARILGFRDITFHALTVSYATGPYSDRDRLLVTLAGYLASLAMLVGGLLWSRSRPVPAALALLVAAPSRGAIWIVALPLMALRRAQIEGGDEFEIARLTGIPLLLVAAFSVAQLIVGLGVALLLTRHRAQSPRETGWGLVGGLLSGLALYATIAPRLLPQ